MAAPFAAIETATAANAVAALANATATIGEASVEGIYDAAYLSQLGIDSNNPVFICRSSDVTSAVRGTAVSINGTSYKVVRKESEGSGMTRLELELA